MMALQRSNPGISLSELLVGFAAVAREQERGITGIRSDSRRVQAGDLFLALPGERSNGADFIADAAQRGAVAALIDADSAPVRHAIPVIAVPRLRSSAGFIAARYYDYPSRVMTLVGVTGTNGKTSVSHYIAQALAADDPKVGLIGTLGYGTWGSLESGLLTTPDAVTLQDELAAMRDRGTGRVVMEVSSHALAQHRVAGVDFRIGVFTNLSRDHLDYHGDMQSYGAAKQRLFAGSSMTHAVINDDDPFGRELAGTMAPEVEVIRYGLVESFEESRDAPPAVRGVITCEAPGAIELNVRSPWGGGEVRVPAGGRFNAWNVLATFAVLSALEIPVKRVLARLAELRGVPGRLEYFKQAGGPDVVVDYAHTPDALAKALDALRATCAGRLYCVFGCGGDRDRGKRPEMGRTAESLSDQIVVTSDNPRSEAPQRIIDDILAGVSRPDHAMVEADRAAAITLAVRTAGAGDVVLIAGKGHETYQEIAGRRYPFSDRELVRRLMGAAP